MRDLSMMMNDVLPVPLLFTLPPLLRVRSRLILVIDPFSVHIRSLTPQIPLERPFKHSRPTQIPSVLLSNLIAPIKLIEIPLVVSPFIRRILQSIPERSSRRSEIEFLLRSFCRCCGRGGRDRSGGGEFRCMQSASRFTFSGSPAWSEIWEITRFVEWFPPASNESALDLDERKGETDQKLWKW